MSVTFKVLSSSGPYHVEIGIGLKKIKATKKENLFSLSDELFANLWATSVPKDSHNILAIEQNKTLLTAAQIIEAMRFQGIQRGSHLEAFGGGIIQDLATIVASLYMRGIDWTYYPTTLLGMVDSCIGGKSSINVGNYKNIAGNFYPPKEIIIDVEFCKTLTLTEQVAGLCEAVKICYASQSESFEQFITNFSGLALPLSSEQLLRLVELSLRTKKTFIEEDEFDRGPRLLLNFGHTFGHAIEAATNFSITHGVAVGMGMLAEIRAGLLLNQVDQLPERVKHLDAYIRSLFKHIPEMVQTLQNLNITKAIEAFKSDKKHLNQSYAIITIGKMGYLERALIPVSDNSNLVIVEIFEWLKKDFIQ